MRHDEATLLAFLDGTLPPREAQAFDAHLLRCERCWAAGEDRRGRESVETLREVAPELPARVRIAVGAAASGRPTARATPKHRCLRQAVLSAAGAAFFVAVGLLLASWIDSSGVPADPPSVAAVVELARLNQATSPIGDTDRLGADGEFPPTEISGQGLWVTRHLIDGRLVVVAASDRPFPMPAAARVLGSGPGGRPATGPIRQILSGRQRPPGTHVIRSPLPPRHLPRGPYRLREQACSGWGPISCVEVSTDTAGQGGGDGGLRDRRP